MMSRASKQRVSIRGFALGVYGARADGIKLRYGSVGTIKYLLGDMPQQPVVFHSNGGDARGYAGRRRRSSGCVDAG